MPSIYLFLGLNYLSDRYLRFKKSHITPYAIKLIITLAAVLIVIFAWKSIGFWFDGALKEQSE
jgi:hypothetical protein